jgi:hypothetical protein
MVTLFVPLLILEVPAATVPPTGSAKLFAAKETIKQMAMVLKAKTG